MRRSLQAAQTQHWGDLRVLPLLSWFRQQDKEKKLPSGAGGGRAGVRRRTPVCTQLVEGFGEDPGLMPALSGPSHAPPACSPPAGP